MNHRAHDVYRRIGVGIGVAAGAIATAMAGDTVAHADDTDGSAGTFQVQVWAPYGDPTNIDTTTPSFGTETTKDQV